VAFYSLVPSFGHWSLLLFFLLGVWPLPAEELEEPPLFPGLPEDSWLESEEEEEELSELPALLLSEFEPEELELSDQEETEGE